MGNSPQSVRWRSSRQVRFLAAFILVVPLTIVLVVRFSESTVEDPSGLAFLPICALLIHFVVMSAYNARIEGDPRGITVVNVVVTHRLPWSDVSAIRSSGLSFLTIELTDGKEVKVWAVQATNLMLMLRKQTRVDRVAAELEVYRMSVHGTEGLDAKRGAVSRIPWYLWLIHAAIVAVGVDWYLNAWLPSR